MLTVDVEVGSGCGVRTHPVAATARQPEVTSAARARTNENTDQG